MRRKLNQDFFKTWSPEMAYVLGFFAADGSMIRNNRGGHFIEFQIADQIILRAIRAAVGSNHKITKRIANLPNRKTLYRLQIGSLEWFGDLSQLGFTQHKSNTLQFPDVPEIYVGDFVRGYFDGDGCIYFRKLQYADRKKMRLVLLALFTSGSRTFLVSLWECLKRYGVEGGSLKKKAHGFELVFSHRDSVALYRLMYHTANSADLRLPRKYRLFTKALKILYPMRS